MNVRGVLLYLKLVKPSASILKRCLGKSLDSSRLLRTRIRERNVIASQVVGLRRASISNQGPINIGLSLSPWLVLEVLNSRFTFRIRLCSTGNRLRVYSNRRSGLIALTDLVSSHARRRRLILRVLTERLVGSGCSFSSHRLPQFGALIGTYCLCTVSVFGVCVITSFG